MIACVYVPSLQSRFYNNDEFECFETEVTEMCGKFDTVLLCVDFNAQTAELPDYTTSEDLSEFLYFDNITTSYYDQKSAMETNSININRKSCDKKKNNHGYKLVDMCKNNNIFILNGRYGNDNHTGKVTFCGISLIDYVISSLNAYDFLTDFNVIEVYD